ncbi:unnamed protein product, partial [Brassica rapa subsp. trilocularis]
LVWADPWLPTTLARPATPCGPSFNPALRVIDLLDPISKAWKLDLLREIVVPEDIPLIQNLKSTLSPRVNRYCWSHTKSGVYSVKSGYALAMETMEASEPAPVLEPS